MLLNSINSLLLTGPRKSEFQPKKLFTNVQAKKRLFVGVVSENRKREGYPWTDRAKESPSIYLYFLVFHPVEAYFFKYLEGDYNSKNNSLVAL